MEREVSVRVLGVPKKIKIYGSFTVGLLVGVLCMSLFITALDAASGVLDPDGNGNTSGGTRTTCATANNFDCINDGTRQPTSPSTAGDYITWNNNGFDSYQFSTLTNVNTATTVEVHVYHIDLKNNMQLEVELWNAAETVQIGSSVLLTQRTTAAWDTATFFGLSLTQADLDDLRIRLTCLRTGGGGPSQCRAFSAYATVGYTENINLTVSATGNQQNIPVGSTNQYIGGVFAITENTSSRSITSITINETGSVNAQTNLSNIRLFYELDATGPSYNCADQTYGGTETQYGATTTFNGANGSATFTGSVTASTTAALCLYVVLDVGAGAGSGEDVEVQITNPTTDVVGSGSPVISPATPVLLPNTTTLLKQDLRQIHYHWRNDDNNEALATSATGGEDTTYDNVARGVNQRLRVEVSNEGNTTSSGTQYRLEYAPKGLSCAASTGWADVGSVGGDWDMAGSGSQLVEGNDTTNIATSTGGVTNENTTFVGTGGQRETSSQTGSISLTSSQYYEVEYAIVANGSASDGATYCFRLTNAGTPIDNYDIYPEATIAADLLVTAFGSQTSFVDIPTFGVYTGGGFSITDSSAGSHTVSEITITASGTVDFQNDIDNVILWYETDVLTPFDCTGESFNGDETQFGATSTNGFSATGTSTFSGSVSVSPTQGICLYVEYDVANSASNGETFEVRITDPSMDITIDTGSISPSALVDITGFTTFAESIPTQQHYHWRNDDGNETGATSAVGGEDTPLGDFEDGIGKRLRFGISNEGATSTGPMNYRLEWAQKISSCAAATGWTDVDTASDAWAMSLSSNFTDGSDTTNISTTTGGVTDEATTFVTPNGGMKESSSQTGAITLGGDEFVEIEYSIIGTSFLSPGAAYCFRVTDAGTPLASYVQYPEVEIKLPTDFTVQRGITNVTGTSVTITPGPTTYTAPASSTRAFVRITNTHMTGAGPSAGTAGNSNASDVTVHITNPANIGTSITFTRAGTGGDTMVAWEIIEYVGALGGENEFVVRDQSTAAYAIGGTTVTTGAVGGIQDDNDVVVFITGQSNPDGGRFDFNTGLSTSAWNAGADTATFTRGETGSDASVVSYAIVEFTGSNWVVQRTNDHTYSQVGVTETETIASVNSLTRAFIHAQHRAGTNQDQHSDFGHEAWLSGSNQVSFRLNGNAQTAGSHVSAAWVIENLQSSGDVMEVHRSNGTITSGGGGLTTSNISIGTTVDDLSVSSIFSNNSNGDTGRSFPEGMIRARLISATQYEFVISDDLGDNVYRTEIVEWPTADPILTQNNYQLYASSTSLDPTDRWPAGATDIGENAEVTGFDKPIASGEWFRLRMSLRVAGAALVAGANAFRLQYGERSTTCTAVTEWHNLGNIGSSTALWRGYNTPLTDGAVLSTDPPAVGALNLSDSDVAGTFEEENNTALTPYLVLPGEDIEYDWAVENNGALDKTSYCFRMVYADESLFEGGYNFYPTMRTVGFGVESQDWIWYDDEQNLTPTATLAATNTAPIDIDFDNTIVLRTTLAEFNGADGLGAKFKIQFSESSTFSTSTDVAEIGDCTNLSYWCYDNGAGVDNATVTAKTLGDADACSGGVGDGCGSYNESGTTTSNFVHKKNAAAEYSFTLRNSGARVNMVYYFRVYDVLNNEVVPLASGETYPSLVTKGASLVSTMEGLASSTTIEGVTLDIDTTPTTLNFGPVPATTFWEGAHRLTVDTNGTEGYKILMRINGNLQSSFGATIQPITGTNLSPTPWTTGCQVTATSCFGYHTSDDTLEAVPQTRFSALDTYARVSTTTLDEIAYSSQPVVNEFTDIIYRIYRTELQDAGLYEARIIYITVPIF